MFYLEVVYSLSRVSRKTTQSYLNLCNLLGIAVISGIDPLTNTRRTKLYTLKGSCIQNSFNALK